MPEEQLSQVFLDFAGFVQGDSSMQERLVATQDLDTAVAIAHDAGFAISKADLIKAQEIGVSAMADRELSDEELSAVTGGAWTSHGGSDAKNRDNDIWIGIWSGCAVAGGVTGAAIFIIK
jgi:predicted ribosomally synthesized peptide with nif11-like leader